MAFQLKDVVPWGRNFDEYRLMFQLDNSYKTKKIASFGDGPASFNYEATNRGFTISSFDLIYQFTKEQLQQRIHEVRQVVMEQMRENMDNYIWNDIKDLNELEQLRMSAMKLFLEDYEKGKQDGRYLYHELPNRLNHADETFDLGLSSHFLLLYPNLGYEFHINAITEMLRVCKEVRIFPIVDLDANETELTSKVIEYFKNRYDIEIRETLYQFQKGSNKLLVINR